MGMDSPSNGGPAVRPSAPIVNSTAKISEVMAIYRPTKVPPHPFHRVPITEKTIAFPTGSYIIKPKQAKWPQLHFVNEL